VTPRGHWRRIGPFGIYQLKLRPEQNILAGYPRPDLMPLYIKDNATADLVARLARMRGLSKQDAVKLAVEAELKRGAERIPLRDRLRKLWAENPLPPRTRKRAGKAFFDDLSGGL
jgi:antitoxin VapB